MKTSIMADMFPTLVKKCLFQACTAASGSSSAEEAAQTPMLTGKQTESLRS